MKNIKRKAYKTEQSQEFMWQNYMSTWNCSEINLFLLALLPKAITILRPYAGFSRALLNMTPKDIVAIL